MILLLGSFFFASAQTEFPYSKMLRMSSSELLEANFKYDKNKNQYVLTRSQGLQKTANILNAINGATADIRPHSSDYKVIIQNGESGVAFVSVIFYSDDTFHELLTFANDHGNNLLETNSGKLNKLQFNYSDYAILLEMNRIGVTAVTTNTRAAAKALDESYNEYTYSIITGIQPSSKWHTKNAGKQEKRDDKGKKKSNVADLM